MTTETHTQLANFIWSICNLLRGPYKRNEYRKVILPLTVLRRFDCILAPTKAKALKEHKSLKGKGENIIRHRLSRITGVPFYNLSKFTLGKPEKGSGLNGILDDTGTTQVAASLNNYINGFSPNVRSIMERFGFGEQIARMAEKDLQVGLQYYRLRRIHSGEISLDEGDAPGVKSPTDVGTGKPKEEKAPLSEIIKVLNDRFGTNFADEDRFFFEQIREKAVTNEQVIKLRRANPFDKFQLGLRQLIDDLMVQRMAENDRIVTRYMDDKEFGDAAFTVLSKAIYDSIPTENTALPIE